MIAYKFAIPATQNNSAVPQKSQKTNFSINFSSKSFVRIKSCRTFALANENKTVSTRSLKDFHKLFVEKYKKQTLQRK